VLQWQFPMMYSASNSAFIEEEVNKMVQHLSICFQMFHFELCSGGFKNIWKLGGIPCKTSMFNYVLNRPMSLLSSNHCLLYLFLIKFQPMDLVAFFKMFSLSVRSGMGSILRIEGLQGNMKTAQCSIALH